MLRLPDGMRDQLKSQADQHGRSMNAEIVQRLEWSFAVGERERVQLDVAAATRVVLDTVAGALEGMHEGMLNIVQENRRFRDEIMELVRGPSAAEDAAIEEALANLEASIKNMAQGDERSRNIAISYESLKERLAQSHPPFEPKIVASSEPKKSQAAARQKHSRKAAK